MKLNKQWQICIGFITPIVFWITIICSGLLWDNYSHSKNLVSELGKIGTKSQYIFATGLILCGILSIIFVAALYKIAVKHRLNTTPILIILLFSLSILGAATFPMPLKLHGILGSPAVVLFLSPLLSLLLWEESKIKYIKFFSAFTFVIMMMGFLIYAPFLDEYFGLKQRFFHCGWSFWFIYLSVVFIGMQKKQID